MGGSVPTFFRWIVHFRCLQVITKVVKTSTEILLKEVFYPFKCYNSDMLDEIYTDLEEYFLKRDIEIHFGGFNLGSGVDIKYLHPKPAPVEFRQIVKKRLQKQIISLIKYSMNTEYINLKDIMGPYVLYEESEYARILDEIISPEITYTFKRGKIELTHS